MENNIKITEVDVIHRRAPLSKDYYETKRNGSARFMQREWSKDHTEFKSTTRVYVWPKGQNIWENLMARGSEPYKAYKPLVEKELHDAGYTGKIRWDRHAGCKMCPCSPGFVLETQLDYSNPVDVHITVTEK